MRETSAPGACRDRREQNQAVAVQAEAVQTAEAEHEHAGKAEHAAERFPSREPVIFQQSVREQQRKEGLRAREDRGLRAGRTGETDIVANVLEHALEQADHKDRPVFAALRTNTVSHAGRDEQYEYACEREAPSGEHQLRERVPCRDLEQLVSLFDAGRGAAPERGTQDRRQNKREKRIVFPFHIYIPTP